LGREVLAAEAKRLEANALFDAPPPSARSQNARRVA
jgi:hypothetical protein